MVKAYHRLILITLLLFTLSAPAIAEVVINEVMSNEPGGSEATSLEWIELYNNSAVGASLGFYTIIQDGTPLSLPGAGIAADGYLILCRKLYADAQSPGFESYWGDSSGVWGDNPELENYDVVELSTIRLTNTGGNLVLNRLQNTVSTFSWSNAGDDGVSWERYLLTDTVVRACIDPSGSTPGRENSVTPRDNDLSLLKVEAFPTLTGECGIRVRFANIGLQSQPAGDLSFYYDPESDSIADSSTLIAVYDFSPTEPGDTLDGTAYFDLDGYYPNVLVSLPDDDRIINNRRDITAFGRENPPVVLSEFIADPKNALETEWVELKNRSPLDINLKDWFLGDANALHPVINSDYILPAGEYVVLARDTSLLKMYYNDIPQMIQVSSWSALNNDSDLVRLRDNYGFVIDSFRYDYVYGGNYSWGRGEDPGKENLWGRSVDSGGTPGYPNLIYYQASGSGIQLTVDPNPFSPTVDHTTVLSFTAPPGESITMKIYDTEGREVKTLIDNLPSYDGQVEWDGRSNGGRRLPVGIYIVYMEVSNTDQYKQTIVIAP